MAGVSIPCNASVGWAQSPVIIPCYAGSGRISPWSQLVFSFDSSVPTVKPFQRWDDAAAGFTVVGNGEPIAYTHSDGNTDQPHVGHVVTAGIYGSDDAYNLNNPLLLGFMKKLLPANTPWNDLSGTFDFHDTAKRTDGTGPEHRGFVCPALRRVIYHPVASERAYGFSALKSFTFDTLTARPFFHNGANAQQTATFPTAPFPGISYSGGNVNFKDSKIPGSGVDHLGNSRTYFFTQTTPDGYNAWDPGHDMVTQAFSAACAGYPLGYINLWQNWVWYVQAQGPDYGFGFNQPRLAYYAVFNTVFEWLAGFPYADPNLVKSFCGGNNDGQGHGISNNSGWKPSDWLDRALLKAIGTANGGTYTVPNDLLYYSAGCSGNAIGCLCPPGPCGPAPSPGTGGCQKDGSGNNTGHWIGPDGVDYFSMDRGQLTWQGAMWMQGIGIAVMFWDYWTTLYGLTNAPYPKTTYDKVKAFAQTMAQQLIDRYVESNAGFDIFPYAGVYSSSEFQIEPAGYDFTVAQQARDYHAYCDPSHASMLEVHAVANRTNQYISAQRSRGYGDESFSLLAAGIAPVRGPFDPTVEAWLDLWLPLPGTSDGTETESDYVYQARYLDLVYALRESGSNSVFINTTPVGLGVQVAATPVAYNNQFPDVSFGCMKVSVVVSTSGHGVIVQGVSKFGLKASATFGTSITIPSPEADFGIRAEGTAFLGIQISGGGADVGWKVAFQVRTAGTAVLQHVDPVAFGAMEIYGGRRVPISAFGWSVYFGVSTVWVGAIDPAQFGLAVDFSVKADRSAIIKATAIKFGIFAGVKPVDSHYVNTFSASGQKIVLEG